MKILIAADLHWPVHNGVATFSRNLARGLAEQGHEVIVIAPSQDGKKSVEVDGNYTIYRTRSTIFPFYQNFRISLTPQLEVRKIIQEFEPDIIHIQMLMWIGQAAMFFGRRYDIPVVTTSHAMPENLMDNLKRAALLSRPINYMLADYGRRFHSRADVITSPTESGLKSFGKHVDKVTKPIEIVSNGIDLREYTPGPADPAIYKKYNLPTDRPIVTYIGRMDAEKHLWVLIKAMRRLLKEHDVHALVVGDGVDREHMQELSHELGIAEHITFTGRISDEDKIALERVGTLYAISSPAELQSIATLEAMACGQPVVAVDAGALAELCHDAKNGFLFALDDDEGMAEGIAKIITDIPLRKKFSEESLRIAKTHDLDNTIAAFIKLYKRTIKLKKQEVAARPAGFVDRIKESEFAEYMDFWSNEEQETKK
ncbi:glycosyltransferase family 4 protein [Candidatus Saccharibacteria bacterium]|nr:glycosyltransferase family 4 protein [Candidatus Saccharibacteria bacterium]